MRKFLIRFNSNVKHSQYVQFYAESYEHALELAAEHGFDMENVDND